MSTSVAIVGGGGGVGSSLAFNLLLREEPFDVALMESKSGMARSHEMDLQQVVAAGASGRIRVVEPAEIAAADIVVLSASMPQAPSRSRMNDLRDNAEIAREIGAMLAAAPDWDG